MNKVLITGARAPVAIDLGRSFSAAGYAVYFADSVCALAAKASTVSNHRVIRFASPRYEFATFAKELNDWVLEFNPKLILPTCEEVFYIAAAAHKYNFSSLVFCPSLIALEKLHSKIKFIEFAKSLHIGIPQTHVLDGSCEAQDLPFTLQESVVKPEYSRFGTQILIKPTAAAFEKLSPCSTKRWIVQEYIEGDELCLWCAAVKGRIVASAAYRPVWRYGHSAAYAFEGVDSSEALKIAEVIVAAEGLTGQLSFDMILTRDRRVIPIECNPRSTSGLHLFDASPDIAHAVMNGVLVSVNTKNIRYLSLAMLFIGLPTAVKSRELKAYFNACIKGQDALGRKGDRLMVVGALLDGVRFVALGLANARSGEAQSTDDIEWNGEPLL